MRTAEATFFESALGRAFAEQRIRKLFGGLASTIEWKEDESAPYGIRPLIILVIGPDRQGCVAISMSGFEILQVSGSDQILALFEARTLSALAAMKNAMEIA